MPALLLIGAWQHFDLLLTTLIAFTGGLLGVLLMIPMRRVFVVHPNSELKFPEALACASVLKAGDSAGSEARGVLLGAILGGVFKALVSFFGILKGILEQAVQGLGDRIFYFGGDNLASLAGGRFHCAPQCCGVDFHRGNHRLAPGDTAVGSPSLGE